MPRASVGVIAAALLAALAVRLASAAQVLSFFGASDVHFGHDVIAKDNSTTTSLELNRWAAMEMNALPLNDSWPAELGGGVVQTPVGLIITGDVSWVAQGRPRAPVGASARVRACDNRSRTLPFRASLAAH